MIQVELSAMSAKSIGLATSLNVLNCLEKKKKKKPIISAGVGN